MMFCNVAQTALALGGCMTCQNIWTLKTLWCLINYKIMLINTQFIELWEYSIDQKWYKFTTPCWKSNNWKKGYDILHQHVLNEMISKIDTAIKKFNWSSESKIVVVFLLKIHKIRPKACQSELWTKRRSQFDWPAGQDTKNKRLTDRLTQLGLNDSLLSWGRRSPRIWKNCRCTLRRNMHLGCTRTPLIGPP